MDEPQYIINNKLIKYYDKNYDEDAVISDDNETAFNIVVNMAIDIVIELYAGLTVSDFLDKDTTDAKELVYEFFKDSDFSEDTKKLIYDSAMESILEYYFSLTFFNN
jgi:hypothetical protein